MDSVRSHVGWRRERNILYKGWKLLPNRPVLKILRESPKRTISSSGGLGLLQIISESGTERCASKDARPWGEGGDWVISPRLEGGTKYSL